MQRSMKAEMKPRRTGSRRSRTIGLALTSMIDVVFLLLIYFVVTASFVEDEGVLIAKLPGSDPPPSLVPIEELYIDLASHDAVLATIEIDAQRFHDFPALTRHLRAIQQNPSKGRHGFVEPETPLIIRPRGDVRWQHVANAFNSGVAADYPIISFAAAGVRR